MRVPGCPAGIGRRNLGIALAVTGSALFCLAMALACATFLFQSGHRGDAYGRSFLDHPSPRCCFTADCLSATREGGLARTGSYPTKHAFVTSLRTPEYMVLLRDLQCSLTATNPGIPLVVLAVSDELSPAVIAEIKSVAQYREVPNIEFPNHEPRYSKNWFKLNAWALTEYESLILLDADMVVLGDLTHIFDLPTDFAWSYLNAPDGYAYNAGGFVMLRPCKSVFAHILQTAEEHSMLYRRNFAEQSFLAWYFAYTGYRLPMTYNANFHFLTNGLTAGGSRPLVVHFANAKPFDIQPGDDAWEYMCSRYQEHHRKSSHQFVTTRCRCH